VKCWAWLLCAVATCAPAQGFPSKPIKLVAPFAPGGALDLIARGVAVKAANLKLE